MASTGRPATPVDVSDDAIQDSIEFWVTTPGERITVGEVRDQLSAIRRLYQEEIFENNWENYTEILDERGLRVLVDSRDVLIVEDTKHAEWTRVYDRLGIENPTMQKVLRLLHAQVGTRIADPPADVSPVLVVPKPEWLQSAATTLRV